MNMKRRSYHLTLASAANVAQEGISFAQALDHGRSNGAAEHARTGPAPRTGSVSRHLPLISGSSATVACR
jgi:hypothetical protein